jgi:hypothetical protein
MLLPGRWAEQLRGVRLRLPQRRAWH